MSADLHIHSNASDGSLSPSEIVKIAYAKNLRAFALTDHDTFKGIEEAQIEADKLSIDLIPGVELSCNIGETDVHILAYWPDVNDPDLLNELKERRKNRKERAIKFVEKLNNNGIHITFDDVLSVAKGSAIGRSHIARAMKSKNYVGSIQEAFNNYIDVNSCCYVKKESCSPEEVLKMIKKAKGVATIAHPGVSKIDEHFLNLKKLGLAGLEVYHPDHNKSKINHYEKLAKKLNLIATGGSDFHARRSSRGITIGAYSVEMETVEKLRKKSLKLLANT